MKQGVLLKCTLASRAERRETTESVRAEAHGKGREDTWEGELVEKDVVAYEAGDVSS